MKTLIFLACLLPVTLLAERTKPHHAVHVRNTKSEVFYFKVASEFWGADIEVRNEKQEVILKHRLTHKKALIDFYYELPGNYTISFVKGDLHEEFSFVKTAELPETGSEEARPVISVIEDLY
jgi:hypothetical protein